MSETQKYYIENLVKDSGVENKGEVDYLKNILSIEDGLKIEEYFVAKKKENSLSSLRQSIVDGGKILDSNLQIEGLMNMDFFDKIKQKDIVNIYSKHLIKAA